MARVIPDGWRDLEATGAAGREIETLELLARSLPDAYTVYHAVHWTNLERGFSVYGEIDFEALDDKAVRKLFVGATRAMMKLVLVISERSAAVLLERHL